MVNLKVIYQLPIIIIIHLLLGEL